jgi:hypothetical protein
MTREVVRPQKKKKKKGRTGTQGLTKWVTKVKPDINSVEVHPHPSHNGHPVDGVLVGVGSLFERCYPTLKLSFMWGV